MSNDQSPRSPDEFQTPQIRFVGEQDGPSERRLKEQLVLAFGREQRVSRAYLARAEYEGQTNVILALRADGGSEKALVQEVASIFASMFGGNQYLDVFFLDDRTEPSLEQVCRSFFESHRAN
jgi:type III secretion system (T3SS) SseB-like protein